MYLLEVCHLLDTHVTTSLWSSLMNILTGRVVWQLIHTCIIILDIDTLVCEISFSYDKVTWHTHLDRWQCDRRCSDVRWGDERQVILAHIILITLNIHEYNINIDIGEDECDSISDSSMMTGDSMIVLSWHHHGIYWRYKTRIEEITLDVTIRW